MISIVSLNKGDQAKVSKIDGGEEIRKRMVEQGIRPGVEIEIFSAKPGSATIVLVNGSRVMIDQDTSKKVYVDTL